MARRPIAENIRREFIRGEMPLVTTVGDLVDQLMELPREMPLTSYEEDEGVRVVVYNANMDMPNRCHVEIEEA